METNDKSCAILPYFRVKPGEMSNFKKICEEFVAQTEKEENVLYYGFCFDGDMVTCREGYADGDAAAHHLQNVGHIIEKALQVSELERLEIQGPETEIEKIRPMLEGLSPQYFALEIGFRR